MMLKNNPLIHERHIPSIFLFASALATYSYANKRKVGCIIAQHDVLFTGYNGTPVGWDNVCEDENNKSRHDVIERRVKRSR